MRNKQVVQVSTLVAIAVIGLNVAFYFLSDWYVSAKARERQMDALIILGQLDNIRFAFGIFTGLIGAASIVASLAPRLVGHGIAALLGLGSIAAAVGAFMHGMTPVLPTTLLLIGGLLPALAVFSLQRSRAAWSFLTALCAVYGTVLLFGAPKVRGLLDIGLWTALIIPGLLAVATIALAMTRADYREQAT